MDIGRPVTGGECLVPTKSSLTSVLVGLSIHALVIPDEFNIKEKMIKIIH